MGLRTTASLVTAIAAVLLLSCFGSALLVRNDPALSDVAIVLGGDDRSYWPALSALKRGDVKYLLVSPEVPDVEDDFQNDAANFVNRTAGDLEGRIFVAPPERDSDTWTGEELRDLKAYSAVVFVPECYSRLERTRLAHKYPQYRWSVSAVRYEDEFDRHWWRKRAWAKRFVSGLVAWVKWAA